MRTRKKRESRILRREGEDGGTVRRWELRLEEEGVEKKDVEKT